MNCEIQGCKNKMVPSKCEGDGASHHHGMIHVFHKWGDAPLKAVCATHAEYDRVNWIEARAELKKQNALS